jgi:hypothetical protein
VVLRSLVSVLVARLAGWFEICFPFEWDVITCPLNQTLHRKIDLKRGLAPATLSMLDFNLLFNYY